MPPGDRAGERPAHGRVSLERIRSAFQPTAVFNPGGKMLGYVPPAGRGGGSEAHSDFPMEMAMRGASGTPTRSKAIHEIQSGFQQLTRGLRMLTREAIREAAKASAPRRRRVSRGRRIHGRYIGLIRNLPPRMKAKVRSIRARKGVDAAIRLAKELRRGH
jgi:hypothetical protein